MTNHTPTTDQVRRFWQYASNAWLAGYADDNDVGPLGESHGSAFDRWLAAHDRKIAAEAWDEAYMRGRHPWRDDDQEDPIPPFESPPLSGPNANPYRADRIEQGGES